MKRLTAILLICGIICVSLTGCGRPADKIEQESISAVTELEVPDIPGIHDDNLSAGDHENAQGLGEDYVYDYQVSMEPIPKEIADLGGPCQGTIHAFPSKIQMGLTQKMIEEDPELKAEVEKRIPEVEKALAEELGGEFRVDGVIIVDDVEWEFSCSEVNSEYTFWIRYDNIQYYYDKNMHIDAMNNRIYVEDYYEPQKTEAQKSQFNQLISKSFDDGCTIAWISGLSRELVTIRIAQFTDNEIDKTEEQIKLLNVWKDLKEYNPDALYNICLAYYPVSYRETIEKKFDMGSLWDIRRTQEAAKKLIHNGEVIAELWYDDLTDGKGDMGWDILLEEYKEEKYTENKIWPYWLSE